MRLDLVTLLWVMTLVTTVMGVAVLLADPRVRGGRGLGAWGLGLLANGASYPAFAWRFEGDAESSIVLTNLLASGGLALHTLAVAQFRTEDRPPTTPSRAWLVFLPVLLTGLIALASVEDHQARNALVAIVMLAQAAWLLRLALPPGSALAHERGRLMLVLGTTLLALLLATRAARVAFGEGWHESQAIAPDIQATTYFVMLAVLLLNTTGYLLMHMERAIEQQRSAATHDALTGAMSRRALMEAFEQGLSLAEREGQPYAVLMLDLDRFKRVNDEHGHPAGDAVLRQFVQRVSQRLRRYDLLGRYGGEEFLVLLPGTDRAGACAVAENLRQAVEAQAFTFGATPIPVTVSVGVCARSAAEPAQGGLPADNATRTASPALHIDSMIDNADRALYAAKRHGRNRVEVAD